MASLQVDGINVLLKHQIMSRTAVRVHNYLVVDTIRRATIITSKLNPQNEGHV